MGTRDHHGEALAQKQVAQGLWKALVGQVAFAHRGGFDVVFAYDVADDDEVGRGVKVGRRIGRRRRDAPVFELGAHGRVHVFVRAANLVAGGLEEAREGAHACARYADEVNRFHGNGTLSSLCPRGRAQFRSKDLRGERDAQLESERRPQNENAPAQVKLAAVAVGQA